MAAVDKRADMFRPCANYPPSPWGDSFSSIIIIEDQITDRWLKEVEELKAEVRYMLTTDHINSVQEKLSFIDTLERLGISYLFHNEIEAELEKIFVNVRARDATRNETHDLSFVSLYFRILRQHGFPVSSDVFDSFKDVDGFRNDLNSDAKGLLTLYEAAHTRIHGEGFLEEALSFASTQLELMLPQMPPFLAKHVSHALVQSLHKGIPRVETRFFISLYDEKEEKSKDYDAVVLRLAKLDFNLLQILHRKELAQVSRWWKDLFIKFPYARDRMVELYFWILGVYFEPQYSLARVMLTKTISILSIIDDTYDAYGIVDELKIFTEAVQRWDISEINRLPEYMKALYKALLQLYDSFEEELHKLGRSYVVSHSKERMIGIIESYYIEAKWFLEGYTPLFEEYLQNGLVTSTYPLLTTASLLVMQSATMETFQWLKTDPKIVVASSTISRLVNDLANYKSDKEKGQITTGIDCYMKQYGVTILEAMDELNKIVENAWKDLNECCLKPKAPASGEILMRVVNLARLIDAVYKQNQDGFANHKSFLKPQIIALLVDNFEI